MNIEQVEVVEKNLCEECSYYRELTYKPELDAHLCEQCYDLPIK
jgi:hypothetical protein